MNRKSFIHVPANGGALIKGADYCWNEYRQRKQEPAYHRKAMLTEMD
jgi:hypothetical protein